MPTFKVELFIYHLLKYQHYIYYLLNYLFIIYLEKGTLMKWDQDTYILIQYLHHRQEVTQGKFWSWFEFIFFSAKLIA